MQSSARQPKAPSSKLWLRFLILAPLTIVMIVGSNAYIRSVCATYEAWTPVWLENVDFTQFSVKDVRFTNPGIVEASDVAFGSNGAACVTFQAITDGKTSATFGDDNAWASWDFEVRNGAILCNGFDFTGWEAILVCLCVFFAVAAALCTSVLVHLQRRHWYGYGMVASCGGMLFLTFQFALFTALLVRGSLRSFIDFAFQISSAADYFAFAALIPMGILAVLVSVSNISLILHEGARPVNVFGIVVSVIWIAVTLLWFHWWYVGSALSLPVATTQMIGSAIAIALAYGECLLIATIICAWIASRKVPDGPMNYLVVLGCGIQEDGTPSPLLAGRVNRALEFDAACVSEGAAPATFVPSGGQGPDEIISEAQSMRDFLTGKGVEPERIVLEDRSTSTQENMTFSRKVIEEAASCDISKVSVGFSTTNFHVFRGYVCAHEAGMAAQGMGSKTRAYFWPNAFLREFAGLLAARWKGILVCYAVITALYCLAEYMLILS